MKRGGRARAWSARLMVGSGAIGVVVGAAGFQAANLRLERAKVGAADGRQKTANCPQPPTKGWVRGWVGFCKWLFLLIDWRKSSPFFSASIIPDKTINRCKKPLNQGFTVL